MRIESLTDLGVGGVKETKAKKAESGFGDFLNQALTKLNDQQNQAQKAATALAVGKSPNVMETLVQLEEADLTFRMAMAVRNKVISAYQEIMRMQF